MANIGNRKEDSRLEKITNEFLDKYFFNEGFEKSEWATLKEDQVNGIDIVLTSEKWGLKEAKVDIKSAVKYSNRYLGTYSLELSFIGRNYDDRIGWFVNDGLETEYYLLLYPKSKKYYMEIQGIDDIDYIDYYLVKKEDLMKFFQSRGYDKERLIEVSNEMRKEFAETRGDKIIRDSGSENFHFTLSGKLAEQPVNAVVKRQVYEKYATIKGRITK